MKINARSCIKKKKSLSFTTLHPKATNDSKILFGTSINVKKNLVMKEQSLNMIAVTRQEVRVEGFLQLKPEYSFPLASP